VLSDDGTTARLHDLRRLAVEHDLTLVSIPQLLEHLNAEID
jgi:3,4-dihydroxy-2-butanone 4-phosphate synthase